jgi:hypothetical protein
MGTVHQHRVAVLQWLFNRLNTRSEENNPILQFYINKLQQGKPFKLWGEWFNPVGSLRKDPI